jgi:Fe-S-cluster containining protein
MSDKSTMSTLQRLRNRRGRDASPAPARSRLGKTPSGWLSVPLSLTFDGGHLDLRVSFSPEPMRLSDLAPLARQITDQVSACMRADMRRRGMAVSCRKGCSTCCRYLVPVSAPEAFRRWEELLQLPQETREMLDRRFATAAKRIIQAGPPPTAPGNTLQELSDWYAKVERPCPLLENDACLLYSARPLACSEYCVMSSPEDCSRTGRVREPVRAIPAVSVAQTLFVLTAQLEPEEIGSVMLPLLPQWAEENLLRVERTWDSRELVGQFTDLLVRRCESSRHAVA